MTKLLRRGNQPADIRMINRRFKDPASTNGLENNALQISFILKL